MAADFRGLRPGFWKPGGVAASIPGRSEHPVASPFEDPNPNVLKLTTYERTAAAVQHYWNHREAPEADAQPRPGTAAGGHQQAAVEPLRVGTPQVPGGEKQVAAKCRDACWHDSVQLGAFEGLYVPDCPGVPQDLEEKERCRSRGVPGYTGVQPRGRTAGQQQEQAAPGGRPASAAACGQAWARPCSQQQAGRQQQAGGQYSTPAAWGVQEQASQAVAQPRPCQAGQAGAVGPAAQQQQQGHVSPRYFDSGLECDIAGPAGRSCVSPTAGAAAGAALAAAVHKTRQQARMGSPVQQPASSPSPSAGYTDRQQAARPTTYSAFHGAVKQASWRPGQPASSGQPYRVASAASIAAYGGVRNNQSGVAAALGQVL